MEKLLIFLLTLHVCHGQLYPKCWIRNGECLDLNEGPLTVSRKPLINQNIIGNSTSGITRIDECMQLCLLQNNCSYFTWYPKQSPKLNDSSCFLVGFNLRQACFNLEDTCVLMKECQNFNTSCTTCQTGMRPVVDPRNEPLAVLLTGVTDNRLYRQQQTRQYKLNSNNKNELILNLNVNRTCFFRSDNLVARMGPAAGYVNSTLLVCGGYVFDDSTNDDISMTTGTYVDTCQMFIDKNAAWTNASTLNAKRAFASSVVAKDKTGQDMLFILGGYDRDQGFLDSVEQYQNGAWNVRNDMKMPVAKSHFCTVYVKNQNDLRSLYTVGGWNIQYLKSFYRVTFTDTDTIKSNNWEKLPDMIEARSDHACAFMQYQWMVGILVAGGYGDGAWLRSVEFFNFKDATWLSLPALTEGRHYHGMTSVGLIPMVFGGWNNGSLNSYEMLDFCQGPPVWTKTTNFLQIRREKFGFASVPKTFSNNCD